MPTGKQTTPYGCFSTTTCSWMVPQSAAVSDADHRVPTSKPLPPADGFPMGEEEAKRLRGRERMARRRAAIKALPSEKQVELIERARAARAKYRETHRYLLVQKERTRRQKNSTLPLEEYLERRRIRESRPCYCTSKHHPRTRTDSAPPPPPPFKTE
ncbi:hypothetical protein B0H11DRAFT_1925388 [Mycena galericulata]|nr:hypothetical protein B0H11DRAFT_1925388 [Mycena galericulata]